MEEYEQLRRGLRKRGLFLSLTLLELAIAFGILGAGVILHYPQWIVLALAPATGVLVVMAGLQWRLGMAHLGAYRRLEEIVHEEWRTGAQILPADLPVDTWYHIFRAPPALTQQDLRKMRRVSWATGRPYIAVLVVWGALNLSVLFVSVAFGETLGLSRWILLLVFVASTPPLIVFVWWTGLGKTSLLLHHLRKYEEITRSQILPLDLRQKR